ncbi:MAG: crossover junction endodeoxyribonuclease RuvC [Spirochaetota bacterium]
MRILSIDPGYATLGWAIIEGSLNIIGYGSIETDRSLEIDERLFIIHRQLNQIIESHKPDCLAIEKLFFAKNTKTAIDVAKCIGVILLTAKIHELSYSEYTPLQVKAAITGYGRAAKGQIQNIIMKIYKLKELPRPDDVADALAIAACHFLNMKSVRIKSNDRKT